MKHIFVSVVFLLLLSGCFGSRDNVALATPTSGEVLITLVETNGGATTSFGYEVYVSTVFKSSSKELVAKFYGATRSERAYGINLVWKSKTELELQYYQTKSVELIKQTFSFNKINYTISVKSGVIDSVAPSGGMLYNLQGRPYG